MASTPAGWYPDPENPQSGQRYWDGSSWGTQTAPTSTPPYAGAQAPPAAGYSSPGYPTPGYGGGYPPYGTSAPDPSQPSGAATLWRRNQLAAITVGVCVLYAVLAFYAHFVFIGVLPILLTVRSFRRREPLAAVALTATVISVGISLFAFAH